LYHKFVSVCQEPPRPDKVAQSGYKFFGQTGKGVPQSPNIGTFRKITQIGNTDTLHQQTHAYFSIPEAMSATFGVKTC